MKENYIRIELETIAFENMDVITQSPNDWEDNELHELD